LVTYFADDSLNWNLLPATSHFLAGSSELSRMSGMALLMIANVLCEAHQSEIIKGVVPPIMVNVVNNMSGRNWAKVVFVDAPMKLLARVVAVVIVLATPPQFAAIHHLLRQ
jgi:hypothetical protein